MRFYSITTLLLTFMISSCKTYYIPKESLIQQFRGIDSSQFKEVLVKGPIGENYRYWANPITVIHCVDKKNNPAELINSPSIEMRVTHRGKKTIFYFDRIYVGDSSVTGVESRFISSIRKTIPLSDISKIEVQDGRKNYHYAE
jgi:hypothetical protein